MARMYDSLWVDLNRFKINCFDELIYCRIIYKLHLLVRSCQNLLINFACGSSTSPLKLKPDLRGDSEEVAIGREF